MVELSHFLLLRISNKGFARPKRVFSTNSVQQGPLPSIFLRFGSFWSELFNTSQMVEELHKKRPWNFLTRLPTKILQGSHCLDFCAPFMYRSWFFLSFMVISSSFVKIGINFSLTCLFMKYADTSRFWQTWMRFFDCTPFVKLFVLLIVSWSDDNLGHLLNIIF